MIMFFIRSLTCVVFRRSHVPKDHGGAAEEPEAGHEEWEIFRRAHPGVYRPFRRCTPGQITNTVPLKSENYVNFFTAIGTLQYAILLGRKICFYSS